MGATNSLSSLLQEDLNSQKKQKVNVYVSDDDIIIHAVKRMYDSCWFTKKHMDKWEEKKTEPRHGTSAKHTLNINTYQGKDTMMQREEKWRKRTALTATSPNTGKPWKNK